MVSEASTVPSQGDNDTRNVQALRTTSLSKSSSPSDGDPMEVTPTGPTAMAPPGTSSSEEEPPHSEQPNGHASPSATSNSASAQGSTTGTSTATTTSTTGGPAAQPKLVNTAFIHKLYNMLEDPSIRDLISWSADGEGFLMSPSADFGKVLSQYFKHTNVSSFVRQLNMYGFHKVSDVFHNGNNDSAMWQFKHGNGNFKRGDVAGLREIKRRASRHTLIHRDSFAGQAHHKPAILPQPGASTESLVDPGEARLAHLEYSMHDMHARLVRTEESNTALSAKCQALNESLVKAHQAHLQMIRMLSSLHPDQDSPIRREALTMEREIARQLDLVRNYEDPHESLLSGRQPYFSNMALAEPPSPRQANMEDPARRQSLHAIPPRASVFRNAHATPQQPAPPPIPTTPQRRYGSIGTANPLPNYQRPLQAHNYPPPPPQHPLSNVAEPPNGGPNMGRRHTSADIRVPGWQGHTGPMSAAGGSPLASGQSSGPWPSSPMHVHHPEDQNVRDQLNSFQFGQSRQQSLSGPSGGSQQTTPPLTTSTTDTTPSTLSMESSWSYAAGKFGGTRGGPHLDSSAPATRRSSMASNVHSLLNPAETAERDEPESLGPTEERKRKRIL